MSIDSELNVGLNAHTLTVAVPIHWSKWLARWISNLFCPPTLAAGGVVLLAYDLGTPAGWGWATFYLACVVLVPTLYVAWLVYRGEVTDFHLRVREQRIKPAILALVTAVVAWLVMLFGDAPSLLLNLAGMGIALVAVMFLITLRWKISSHLAAVSGFFTLCWVLLGQAAAPIMPLVPLVAWSRVKLRRHDFLQTAAGAAIGAIMVLAAFHLEGR